MERVDQKFPGGIIENCGDMFILGDVNADKKGRKKTAFPETLSELWRSYRVNLRDMKIQRPIQL